MKPEFGYKSPLSPYSMFTVLPAPSREGQDYPASAQFRLIKTVVMGEDLVGLRGGSGFFRGYNPFDLFGAAVRSRGKPLPPHLVFAELDEEKPDDACAFLNAYGPLMGTNFVRFLTPTERSLWELRSKESPLPDEYFRSSLGEIPLLPDPPAPEPVFYSFPLAVFWKAQSEFELALRLQIALADSTEPVQKVQRKLSALKKIKWNTKDINPERRYIDQARNQVAEIMNRNLATLQPRIARVPASHALTGVWGCYSLLKAMYLMLFLDIAGWSGRIAQCEKCGLPFYTKLDKAKYCTPLCENRARALRAYHKKKGGS